jgi:hypothetical protein
LIFIEPLADWKPALQCELGGAGRAATRRASQREVRHLEVGTLPSQKRRAAKLNLLSPLAGVC